MHTHYFWILDFALIKVLDHKSELRRGKPKGEILNLSLSTKYFFLEWTQHSYFYSQAPLKVQSLLALVNFSSEASGFNYAEGIHGKTAGCSVIVSA